MFCESKEDTEKAKLVLNEWLDKKGLKLSEEKTKIVHLSEGFDFLGFNIRHYAVSDSKTGWKLLIKPSKNLCKIYGIN
ncbi:reverse transcriptase domain-containing protein [Nostoc sp. MG11]|uniref:reverse transcriptase domain-containing protein n=1 Tax=Nostoc sp. MG11 TaxID=2721166 RepID=UPI00186632B5|nr:reverse transcriptase domain-containing protein [Nostoc sp. MG11]